ncbi:MAG: LamG domain-containing protein [Nannocystaceae bacterium]|nr:LamG domain-containing protein [Nannocystaceae bacterium]
MSPVPPCPRRRAAPTLARLLLTAAPGCTLPGFVCEDAAQCEGGQCQADGFCSFPDAACESGQRYGAHAGAHSGTCVPGSGSSGTTAASSSGSEAGDGVGSSAHASTLGSSDGGNSSTAAGSSDGTTGIAPLPEPLLWFDFDAAAVDGVPNRGTLGGVALCSGDACPTPVEGVQGMGAAFDGVDDCGQFAYTPALDVPGGLTIAAWVRRTMPASGFQGIVTKPVGTMAYNSWRLAMTDSDGASAHFHVGLVDDQGGTIEVPLPAGQWSLWVGTWDGAELVLWQDGVVVGSVANALYEVDTQGVFLGCDDEGPGIGIARFFSGELDEVRLWDRVLDDAQIGLLAGG